MAEDYARYLQGEGEDRHLCQCTNDRSFGKSCEYFLPIATGLFEATDEQQSMTKHRHANLVTLHSDVLCYTTLMCDSALLCLDWREICDGVQQCMFAFDEENCNTLEFHECKDNEYQCEKGMCISRQFFLDGEYDCSDMTDEKDVFDVRICSYESVTILCDDRLCPADQ